MINNGWNRPEKIGFAIFLITLVVSLAVIMVTEIWPFIGFVQPKFLARKPSTNTPYLTIENSKTVALLATQAVNDVLGLEKLKPPAEASSTNTFRNTPDGSNVTAPPTTQTVDSASISAQPNPNAEIPSTNMASDNLDGLEARPAHVSNNWRKDELLRPMNESNLKTEAPKQPLLVTERLVAEEGARTPSVVLADLPLLNPEAIIKDCWNIPAKSAPDESVNLVDVATQKPLALPIWAATDVIVKGIEVIAWPFEKLKPKKQPRFIQGHFANHYQNHDYRYYGKIVNVDVKNNTISFDSGGKSKESYDIIVRLRDQISQNTFLIKPGSQIWISGQLIALVEIKSSGPGANRLVLDNSTLHPSIFLSNDK